MIIRRALTLMMAGFLVWNPAMGRPAVLGVVTEADRAHLNNLKLTAGTTIYDGDRLGTEAGGSLRVQSGATILELAEGSVVNVRVKAGTAQDLEAEVGKGTLVFSAARAASLNVIALGATIRPVADMRTVAQITVTGPRELRIRASQGALHFSYRGETETMAAGKSYRVILDPPKENPKRQPKGFKIVIIIEGAAILGLGIHELVEQESPDRP